MRVITHLRRNTIAHTKENAFVGYSSLMNALGAFVLMILWQHQASTRNKEKLRRRESIRVDIGPENKNKKEKRDHHEIKQRHITLESPFTLQFFPLSIV